MKFEIPEAKYSEGDQVKLKGSKDKVGIVKVALQTVQIKNGKVDFEEKLYIEWSEFNRGWHDVDRVQPIYTFDNSFETSLCKLMIDVHLKEKNFDRVQVYYDEMEKYKTK